MTKKQDKTTDEKEDQKQVDPNAGGGAGEDATVEGGEQEKNEIVGIPRSEIDKGNVDERRVVDPTAEPEEPKNPASRPQEPGEEAPGA